MKPKTPAKSSRSRKTLNAANLEALGADRLAAILLDLAEGQPTTKRRLRMELAAQVGPDDLAAELEKRFAVIEAARGRVHWRKLKEFARDLDLLRSMIVGPLQADDAPQALRLGLRFMGLERGVLGRVNDAKGEVEQVFALGLENLAEVARGLPVGGGASVDEVFAALDAARVSSRGALAEAVLPVLDAEAIGDLRARIEVELAPHRRLNAGWRAALHPLLDAQGDAGAYAATFSASEAVLPPIGARIASRLLKAGRYDEAAAALGRSNPHAGEAGKGARPIAAPNDPGVQAWERARIDLLEAQGQGADAQAARWEAFEQTLSAETLKAYLSRLADFDDVVAVDRALDHALTYRPFTVALQFLVAWPALDAAARLVVARADEIDGMAVEALEPAARRLEARYPLAATLLLRAMIQDVARFAQIALYDRAQGWMMEAASLAAQISDLAGQEPHEEFEARIGGYRRW